MALYFLGMGNNITSSIYPSLPIVNPTHDPFTEATNIAKYPLMALSYTYIVLCLTCWEGNVLLFLKKNLYRVPIQLPLTEKKKMQIKSAYWKIQFMQWKSIVKKETCQDGHCDVYVHIGHILPYFSSFFIIFLLLLSLLCWFWLLVSIWLLDIHNSKYPLCCWSSCLFRIVLLQQANSSYVQMKMPWLDSGHVCLLWKNRG